MKNFDAVALGRLGVDGGVPRPRRSDEFQIRQTIQQGRRHYGPLAHDAENIKRKQTLNERFELGDVVVENLDLGVAGNRRPVRHLQGYILIIVQYPYLHIRDRPPFSATSESSAR